MRRTLTILFLCLSFFLTAADVKKVAILETVDKEGKIPYGMKLQVRSSLTFAINRTDGYEGYDRVDMAQITGEQSFQRTGMVSNEQIKKLGVMTGAQYVLMAEVATYDENSVLIAAKMLDVETGAVTNSAPSVIAQKDPEEMQSACIKVAKLLLNIPLKNNSVSSETTRSSREKKEREEQASLEAERKAREAAEAEQRAKEAEAIAKANAMGSLFGQSGSNNGSGDSKGSGQKGNPVGHGSVGGNSWSLAGRGIKGTLPQPSNTFKQEGRVIVEIRVNAAGQVVRVKHKGGDVQDPQTIQLALDAARKAQFTEGDHDQIGTITYIFKLN